MKVGINTTPLYSGHKLRGIGYYTKHLLNYLKKEKDIKVEEFVKLSEIKDVKLVHYPWFDFYFHTLPIIRKYPTVVTIHDVIPLVFSEHYPVGFKGRLNFYLQKLALKSCKLIMTDSQSSKNDIHKYLQIDQKKIMVVPLAADSNFKVLKDQELIKVKRKYHLPDKFILYTGDANWVKNLPFLIESFKKLITNDDFKEVKLVLVGGVFLKNVEDINHPELESLKTLNRKIKEYKLESQVIRSGSIDDTDLVAFYNLATVYIQPSLYEGFGLPVLQAFNCGTPVVSSDAGSLSEVGGKAAIYFKPTDLSQLISILTEVLHDKSLRCKLSKLGFEQAKKFSWGKTVFQIKQIYDLALKEK